MQSRILPRGKHKTCASFATTSEDGFLIQNAPDWSHVNLAIT